MTQIEREGLVERYLSGEMTVAEESDFFLHVAVDDELQRTLKAFRIMDQAIQNDAATAVAQRSHYREQVFGLLVASHPVAGGEGGAPVASAAAGTTAGMLGVWKFALISMLVGGLAVGTWFVLPLIQGIEQPASIPPQVAPQGASETVLPVPGMPVDTGVRDAAIGSEATGGIPSEVGEAKVEQRAVPARTTRGASVRKSAAGVRDTAARSTEGDDAREPYIQLPSTSQDEIKIPTELNR